MSWPPNSETCRWPPPRPPAIWSRPTCRRRTICAGSAPAGRPCSPAATCSAMPGGSTPPGRCPWSGSVLRTRPACSCCSWPPSSRPNPSRSTCSVTTPSCWMSRCARPPPIPTPSPTPSGALVGYSLARRHPGGFQVHRLVQAVIRQQLPCDRQQATAQRVITLLAAASPGDPEESVNWAGYARLAPHVLATCPLGDYSPAGRQLLLDTTRYQQAHGDSHAGRAVSEHLLHRWRSILGPDHPDTLTAA